MAGERFHQSEMRLSGRSRGGGGKRIVIFPHRGFLQQMVSLLAAGGVLAVAAAGQNSSPLQLEMQKSHNPMRAYVPEYVPEPVLSNSPRLDRLVRDGKLYLSLRDAIDL